MALRDSVVKISTSVIYVARAPSLMLTLPSGGMGQIVEGPEVRAEGEAIVVTSMPNQFQAQITPNRLQFLDKSGQIPARGDFANRLVKLAEFIALQNKLSYSAVGINFDISYQLGASQRPSELILHRFVNPEVFSRTEYNLIGAGVRLWYMARDKLHYIYFEPRGNAYNSASYYSHLNIHVDLNESPPTAEWMTEAIQTEYEDFLRVIETTLENAGTGGAR